jgi:DNA N-6-adenine-methyltransferase (Dam)
VQAKHFYTKKDNGLEKEWHGNVFLNPPYKQPFIRQFVDKLLEEIAAGHVKQAIMLTHNYTDTKWFRAAATICSAVCFTNKTDVYPSRTKFETPDGEKASPTQGQAFFFFGNDPTTFARVFADVGLVFPALMNNVAKFGDGWPMVETELRCDMYKKTEADKFQPLFKWREAA